MQDPSAVMKLYIGNYRYSSWSMRGWLALEHSHLPHQVERISLKDDQTKAALKTVSPTALVPLLEHYRDNRTVQVWDSLAILDYMERLTPNHYWWPESDAGFAFARSMVAEMHSGFMALRRACPMNLGKTYSGLTLAPKVAKDVARIDALWVEARSRFGLSSPQQGPFLFGAWSAADIVFAPVVTRFLTYGVKLGQVSRAYMAAVDSYGAVDRWRKAAQSEKEMIPRYEDQIITDGLLGADL